MLIIQGSPRAGGVTDALARAASHAMTSFRVLAVRDFVFAPCLGCNYCATARKCKLDGTPQGPDGAPDQAGEIFAAIRAAKALIIVAPVYFYALPGFFKGFIDRCQLYWHLSQGASSKPAAVILAGAREKGEQLFAGSLLTLRYFLSPLSYSLTRSLCCRGLENLEDLDRHPQYLVQAHALGAEIACGVC